MRYILVPNANGKQFITETGQRIDAREVSDVAQVATPHPVVSNLDGIVDFELPKPTRPKPVPKFVTPLQMRMALNQAGLRDSIEAAVAAAPLAVRDAWEYSTEVRRDNALLAAMSAQLGMASDQVDELFRLAASFI